MKVLEAVWFWLVSRTDHVLPDHADWMRRKQLEYFVRWWWNPATAKIWAQRQQDVDGYPFLEGVFK